MQSSVIRFPPSHDQRKANSIKTSHYTWWNFLPLNLFEQFHRKCNIYFLFVVLLQSLPSISPLKSFSGYVTIGFTMGISALKSALEDYRRHKSDKEVNSYPYSIVSDGQLKTVKCEDIQSGQIVQVEHDQIFPADIILIDSSTDNSVCMVETTTLDGESSLKVKQVFHDFPSSGEAEILCPSKKITEFSAVVNKTFPVAISWFVPRGCVLRKTRSVCGLVVYCGHDCKIYMNSQNPVSKRTELDSRVDSVTICLVLLLFILLIFLSLMSLRFHVYYQHDEYLSLKSTFFFFLQQAISWLILMTQLIPMSLYSGIDMIRFFLGLSIDHDKKGILDEKSRIQCRNSDLVSTIGQVTHLFSDKTGTLTKNHMVFRSFNMSALNPPLCCVEASNVHSERNVKISQKSIQWIKSNESLPFVHDFLLTLCLCNNAISIPNPLFYPIEEVQAAFPNFKVDDSFPSPEMIVKFPYLISYQVSSPDELSFIHFARECGWILYSSLSQEVKVLINGVLTTFSRPIEFEFSSKRKRSSCIVSDNGEYKLICKGADSVMFQRSINQDNLPQLVEEMSSHGFRVLVFSSRNVTNFEEIFGQYREAQLDIENSKTRLCELAEQIEVDLISYAVTGVEDELQDNLNATIKRLSRAGIKTWVLTGDRHDTAMNIATASGIVFPQTEVFFVESNNFEEFLQRDPSVAVAVHSPYVADFLDDPIKSEKFFAKADQYDAIIVSRCEPNHKGKFVRGFMRYDPKAIVAAVGDGGNDVDMIRAASVGIGVESLESKDAVLSSDFSIPSFKFLERLFLVHGRWCNNRVSLFVLISLYKNAILVVYQILYGMCNGWSATSSFDSGYISMYNTILTIPQLFLVVIFEQDIIEKLILAYPELYTKSQRNGYLSTKHVAINYFRGILHSLLIFFYIYIDFNHIIFSGGTVLDYPIFMTISGWAVLFIFTLELLIRFRTHSWLHFLSYILCLGSNLLVMFVFSWTTPDLDSTFEIVFNIPRLWFSVFSVLGIVVCTELILKYFVQSFSHDHFDLLSKSECIISSACNDSPFICQNEQSSE